MIRAERCASADRGQRRRRWTNTARTAVLDCLSPGMHCCAECRSDLNEPPIPSDQAAPVVPPPSEEEIASDRARACRVAVFLSLAVYAVLIGTLFAPEVIDR